MQPGRHQPGDVRHIHHKRRAHALGDLRAAGKVIAARVGGGAHDDHLGAVRARQFRHGIVVDELRLAVHAVGDEVEPSAGKVDAQAVRQVTAVAELHAQGGVAGFHERVVGGEVGLRAGVGLDVGVLSGEQRFGAVDRQRLHLIDVLAAAVIALARIALRVLVGEDRAHGGQDGRAGVVLRGDHLQRVALAGGLAPQGGGDIGVGGGQDVDRSGLNHSHTLSRDGVAAGPV